jgi:hypothetical protein
MAINPFELIKNFKNIQSKMSEMQEKAKGIIVTGSAGGELVNVSLNGKMEVTDIKISKEVVNPDDIEMLEDLIHAAFSDAMIKVKEKLQSEFSGMANGLNLPPGFMGS